MTTNIKDRFNALPEERKAKIQARMHEMTPEQEAEARETMKRVQAEYDAEDEANFWRNRPMLTAIRNAVDSVPFRPFTIVLSNGHKFRIEKPASIEVNSDGDGKLLRITQIDDSHLVSTHAITHITFFA